MAGVKLRSIFKSFGTVRVIEDLNLEVQDGEFMVLVGPSGCGKSTALRMIAGLEEPSSGEIWIGDRIVNDLPPKDRDIAMVFQSYALYPHMTVRENLAFGLKIRKLPRPEIARLVDEAARILDIQHLLDRKPKEMSGGQRQRVAVGRAIVRKPSIFLFDEPLSNLDAKLRVQMRAEISKLQENLGVTTVYVTHDQVEAMTMGNRIAILEAGKLQQVGAPLEVYERPVNVFVANFIGTPPMNFFPATVGPGGTDLRAAEFALPVPAAWRAAAASRNGKGVLVGLRPEKVEVAETGVSGPGHATLLVDAIELLGNEAIVHGRVGTDPLIAKAGPRMAPAVGDRVIVKLDHESIHLFDPDTQVRLEEAPVPSREGS